MMEPVKVLLVDDEPLVRAGLKAILGGAEEVLVVGEAADGREALRRVAELAPQVVLMDIRMPVLDGVAATAQIRSARGDSEGPHVVVLTTFDGDDSVAQALRAGASGYLLKTTPPDRLVAGILEAAAGQPVLSPSVTARLMHAVATGGGGQRDGARAQLELLTERELEVARAVARGDSNTVIAQSLYLSLATIKAHVSRALLKLGLENRVQLALLVRDAQLDL
ncbi:response regulator [Tessaracoccus sp. Y36]|uniref:response regulator n=1 Tax=Tessaracoccus sp. MC1865 TaxID=2760310 RepID=UPI001FD7491B|nr:response regulator transcription factor [Tessaracoccus sp. MC1865]